MNRRDFFRYSLGATALAGIAPWTPIFAAHGGSHRTLVNTMLLGGADLRFLFTPNPQVDGEYATIFSGARASLYPNVANVNNYLAAWQSPTPYYQTPSDTTLNYFGIHSKADWLLQQFNLGNVAIVCNVVAAQNRRHDHAQLIVNSGDLSASQYVYDRDGWGGRLAEAIGAGNANVVATSNDISVFCKSTNPLNRNSQVIHAKDTRNFALSKGDDPNNIYRQRLGRALKSYYRAKQFSVSDKPANWPYRKFLQHEQVLRAFGDPFALRLETEAPQRPLALRELYGGDVSDKADPSFDRTKSLNKTYFARQCANLYDSFIGSDLFKLRVASMELSGWDTHQGERGSLEKNLSDIFGIGKGLDIFTQELAKLPGNLLADTVFVFTTDFGRQLKANGSAGTDHGRGNYMILVGESVNGGVYGEMFPRSEIANLGNGATRYEQAGSDIQGKTSFERVLAAACDWVEPGSGIEVFPNTAKNDLASFPDGPILESGVDLTSLLSTA